MDLRRLVSSRSQVERAKKLAIRGLLNYPPYTFADDFACGSGMSIVQGFRENPPSVYWPDAAAEYDTAEYVSYLDRTMVKPDDKDEFVRDNALVAQCYDGMVDQIIRKLGGVAGLSVLDAGCNAGYFPVSFSRAGAAEAVGLDRVDYSDTFALLNEICGTNASFRQWTYDGALEAEEKFDLVLSVAVLVHLSDPLHHLAWLGSAAKKALFVFTACHQDDDYSIRFHTVNRYYGDRFPYCFDTVTVSRKLLRLAFEKMGFSEIVEITTEPMPPHWSTVHLGLLGLRTADLQGGERKAIT